MEAKSTDERLTQMSGDTIYAFASGFGRAAVGVFRLSGAATKVVVESLTGSLPSPRRAHLSRFIDPGTGEVLDQGLVLWFPGPASFTGEDAAEFHIHAGPAVSAAMTRAFAAFEGLRPAEPGEFTRRAFLNGKLDLSAVEGLGDLIEAETEAQRRQALRQASGALRDQSSLWRAAILEAAALIEGEIDFSDEADVPKETIKRVTDVLQPVLGDLRKELASAHAGERIRDGLTIVIAGPPNAGKSTLLNALARRDVAIVSPQAGTTRDLLEVHLDIDGLAVTLIDTAGLRESNDPVEQIGVSRAREKSKEADLVLWLCEAGHPAPPDAALGEPVWPILTKADLIEEVTPSGSHPEERPEGASRRRGECEIDVRVSSFETAAAQPPQDKGGEVSLTISAATGENLSALIGRIGAFAKEATLGGGSFITRQRHRLAFQKAAGALERIMSQPARPIEFLAEDLRLAARALESLVGGVDVEDVLGEIFSRFCVGK